MVLNPHDLIRSARKLPAADTAAAPENEEEKRKVVLLVEDSIIVLTQEKRILEGAGYEVVTAVDGMDALDKLYSRPFDAVVSDIMMPKMDGLALTARIRQDKRYAELPIILVTTLSSEDDRKKGLEAGANGYLVKTAFDQKILLDTLGRLV